jgi:hypothetical protein
MISLIMTSRPFPRIALVPSHARRPRAAPTGGGQTPVAATIEVARMRSLSASIGDTLPRIGAAEQSEELPSVLRGPVWGFAAGGHPHSACDGKTDVISQVNEKYILHFSVPFA